MPSRIRSQAPRTAPAGAGAPRSPAARAPRKADAAAWSPRAGDRKPPLLGGQRGTLVPAKGTDGGVAKVPAAIAGVPVASARVVRFDGLKGTNPLQQQSVQVRFGTLQPDQFQALQREFGGQSKVKYDPARDYQVADFLPPALQGLLHQDLDVGEPVLLKGTKRLRDLGEGDYTIAVSPNCHGTAWEAARAYQGHVRASVSLHYADGSAADARYADPKAFSPLGRAGPGEAPGFLSSLRPGDVVAFNKPGPDGQDFDLLHSAVYAGGGLFFEKPDTEMDAYTETPYRLATWDQVVAPIQDFTGEAPAATARRPLGPLEPGLTAFAFDDSGKLEAWARKQGTSLGKPLVVELELGLGGGVRGYHASAVETFKVKVGPDGRGVLE